jgi:hypothetical protein
MVEMFSCNRATEEEGIGVAGGMSSGLKLRSGVGVHEASKEVREVSVTIKRAVAVVKY